MPRNVLLENDVYHSYVLSCQQYNISTCYYYGYIITLDAVFKRQNYTHR